MKKFVQKRAVLAKILNSLDKSIMLFNTYKSLLEKEQTETNKELFLGMQDSMIQRFEYCTDLFWKVLKLYLEEIEKVDLITISPKGIIRQSVHAKIISEQEGGSCIEMVTNRNLTSHLYHEELAATIAAHVPGFYKLMSEVIGRLQK